jgi:hypothetical protein
MTSVLESIEKSLNISISRFFIPVVECYDQVAPKPGSHMIYRGSSKFGFSMLDSSDITPL